MLDPVLLQPQVQGSGSIRPSPQLSIRGRLSDPYTHSS
ncbi:hypothetical protein PVAP13_7NG136900 [Panicum virgatum]|uniref:Uncharacterized protein n=1 Tax=Panicum virgatum TaxID=38727 RepID=A0A8T0PZM4_PANVG|nr:hypothetical protein PVAP13_7NG136900 [Panicum virgatum]